MISEIILTFWSFRRFDDFWMIWKIILIRIRINLFGFRIFNFRFNYTQTKLNSEKLRFGTFPEFKFLKDHKVSWLSPKIKMLFYTMSKNGFDRTPKLTFLWRLTMFLHWKRNKILYVARWWMLYFGSLSCFSQSGHGRSGGPGRRSMVHRLRTVPPVTLGRAEIEKSSFFEFPKEI